MNDFQQPACLAGRTAFTEESVNKERLQAFAQALLFPLYATALFFPAGSNRALSSIFPPTLVAQEVARHMRLQENILPCREMAARFPGLFSTMDARQACQCPLKNICGDIRVDAIRLESHGQRLGELMLFAKGGEPVSSSESVQITMHAQALADQLWIWFHEQTGEIGT